MNTVSQMISRSERESAKDRLRIPELWRLLGLEGEPSKLCPSPFREDRKPSFSVYDEGRQAKDFSTGEHFDGISFLGKARGMSNGKAIRAFVELANGRQLQAAPIIHASQAPKPEKKPDLSGLRSTTGQQLNAIARSRGIDVRSVALAQAMGTLRVGHICGYPSWVLTDTSGRCAEARRIDREPYPAADSLCSRKAHTLACSKKNWPVGLLPAIKYREFESIALVEGGPDYLGLLHFSVRQHRKGILPVAMLGRGQGLHGLHLDSLEHFRAKRVRIYPHDDPDGRSYEAAEMWARQLMKLDAKVDFFTFEGITKAGGERCKDLNDCVQADGRFGTHLEELLP
jgi:hypothetical protein